MDWIIGGRVSAQRFYIAATNTTAKPIYKYIMRARWIHFMGNHAISLKKAAFQLKITHTHSNSSYYLVFESSRFRVT